MAIYLGSKQLTSINLGLGVVSQIYLGSNLIYSGITLPPIEEVLVDFEYIDNGDKTYTITNWKGTYNGEPSTKLVVPDDKRIIL